MKRERERERNREGIDSYHGYHAMNAGTEMHTPPDKKGNSKKPRSISSEMDKREVKGRREKGTRDRTNLRNAFPGC